MKKAFKIFGMILLAGAVMCTACSKDDDDNTTTTNNGGNNGGNGGNGGGQPANTTWSASLDGDVLDIAGYSDFQTNGELWLAQFAQNAEGDNVYFPYIVAWFQGNSTSTFAVYPNRSIELYKDTYYTDNSDNQYGDWQYYATNSLTCSALDLTAYRASFSGSFTMYDLGDIVDQTASDPADCTQKTLTLTVSDAVFTLAQKGAMRKMNIL